MRAQYSKYYVLATLLILPLFYGFHAGAIDGSLWKAGRIIDDSIFMDKNSMSVSDIQNFLNNKVPLCDSYGEKTSELGGGTRAEYGAAHNNPVPFTCLKDYYEVPKINPAPGLPASNYGGTPIPAGAKSAAQIIYDAAQRYDISPKVLLVIIQRESVGPLITDDWPFRSQYSYALGAHCPDTPSGCDPNYSGFSMQVNEGARLLRWYLDNMEQPWWAYKKPYTNNYILWNVASTNCGGSNVWLENKSTAALYTYTPYQPNQAALNNMYGVGDGCSAYGNRNFWRYYFDWFGVPYTSTQYAWKIKSVTAYTDPERTKAYSSEISAEPSGTVYMRIKALNWGYKNWEQSFARLGTAKPQDRQSIFEDSSWIYSTRPTRLTEQSVYPGQMGTFDFILKIPNDTGSYKESFNGVAEARSWFGNSALSMNIDVTYPSTPSDTNYSLQPGQEITAGQYLMSKDRHCVLILQKNGNLAQYVDTKMVWSSQTAGIKNIKNLKMQTDGNLVLYDKDKKPIWNTETQNNNGSYLVLQTDGNLVLYDKDKLPLWATYKIRYPGHLTHVNKKMTSISVLLPGQSLQTADKKYSLIFQQDGNLVLYSIKDSIKKALWATGTDGKASSALKMQSDGNLVLYDIDNKPLWHTWTQGQGPSSLVIQSDGNLVIYNSKSRATWNTETMGR